MDNKAMSAAISTIELQLEALKSACGLPQDTGEEDHEDESGAEEAAEHKVPARRGRHKIMPRFKKESE
jgi:hypothetical protein